MYVFFSLFLDGYPYSNYAFNVLLHKFITESRIGQVYSPYIKFSNTTPPVLQVPCIRPVIIYILNL